MPVDANKQTIPHWVYSPETRAQKCIVEYLENRKQPPHLHKSLHWFRKRWNCSVLEVDVALASYRIQSVQGDKEDLLTQEVEAVGQLHLPVTFKKEMGVIVDRNDRIVLSLHNQRMDLNVKLGSIIANHINTIFQKIN